MTETVNKYNMALVSITKWLSYRSKLAFAMHDQTLQLRHTFHYTTGNLTFYKLSGSKPSCSSQDTVALEWRFG